MDKPSQILMVGSTALIREYEDSLGDLRVITYSSSTIWQGIQVARSRRPDLALIEMTEDLAGVCAFAEEMTIVSPESPVVVVFSPEVLPVESETAMLIQALRAGAKDFLRRPLARGEIQQLLERLARANHSNRKQLGAVVSVISNKGGCGKTTLAVNLAVGLARRFPTEVILIDASLQVGHCASMLDLRPITTIYDAIKEFDRLDETLLKELALTHSPTTLRVLAAPLSPLQASEIDDEVLSRVLTLARRAFPLVVIDTFPLFNVIVKTILDLSDRIMILTESTVPSTLGIGRLFSLLDELKYDRGLQQLILSRHSRHELGCLEPQDIQAQLGRPIDAIIPYDRQAVVASNLGIPMLLRTRTLFSRWRRAMERVIESVAQLVLEKQSIVDSRRVHQAGSPTSLP